MKIKKTEKKVVFFIRMRYNHLKRVQREDDYGKNKMRFG